MIPHLNYHHLHYFWLVAREGNLTRASQKLRLSPSTVSAQIHALEEMFGQPLFQREGRGQRLTPTGQTVLRYADEIFRLGGELKSVLAGGVPTGPLTLRVGLTDSLPKLVASRLLLSARLPDRPVHIHCVEEPFDRLLGELAGHTLDLVLADAPAPPSAEVRAWSHGLGESGVGWFGVPALVEAHRADFPGCLDGAPVVLPTPGVPLRGALDAWFRQVGVQPRIVAELQDGALLKSFGEAGAGLFPAPLVVATDVIGRYGVLLLGAAPDVVERFYAISLQRHLDHPAVQHLVAQAAAAFGPSDASSAQGADPSAQTLLS